MTLIASTPFTVSRYLRVIATLLALQAGSQSTAHAEGQALRDMHHTMWTASDGAPQRITDLAQDRDGTLWIGSESGLFNFDGQTFRLFKSPPGEPALPPGRVHSLLVTKSGTLWAGFYEAGIARILAGRVTVFTHADSQPFVLVEQLREAPDGSIWALDHQRRLVRFGPDGRWRREPTPSSAPIAGIFVDAANTLWLAQDGFLHRRPLAHASYTRTKVPADVVMGFAETPDGDIWMNDYEVTTSLGRTQRVTPGGELVRMLPGNLVTSGSVVSTADGSLIVASYAGVRRYSPAEASARADHRSNVEPDVFTREHGLSSNATQVVMTDVHGNIWIGSARGLDRLRPAQLTRYLPTAEGTGWTVCASQRGEVWVANTLGKLYSASESTPTSFPGIGAPLFSLACADGGHAWFMNNDGAWAVVSGRITALPRIADAPRRRQIKVVAASDHTLYATVAGPFEPGSGIWRYKDGRWTKLPREGELGAGGYAAYVDRHDRLWIGYTKGRAILHTAIGAQMLSSGEPGLGYVYAFLETSRGLFAAGTNGLAVLRDSRFEMLTFADASLSRGVRGLVEARDGELWLNGANGFARVPVKELEAGLAQSTYPMKARLIREGDFTGAPQRTISNLDTTARDAEGRLWFVTWNGVVRLDPARSPAASHAPLVTIRSMVADGQPIQANSAVAPGTRTLHMQYFGVNLTAPENVIYRYRLDGFDDSWQEAGRRTEAFYTRLSPGTYTFRVMASNGDGMWTSPVSAPAFTVLPRFYQTRWFAATMIGLVILTAGIVHRTRVRQISRVLSARFDERLAERTRVARELHDTLLQTIHGSKLVADRALRDTTDHHQLIRALEQLSIWLGQAADEGRAALRALRASTTETNDLAAAFRRAIDECRHEFGAEMLFSVKGVAREMHPVVRDDVYRVGYEAIRNACVHSRASRVDVVLEYGRDLTLRIDDNGVGIDAAVIERGKEGHFGLRGMRERAERIGAQFTLVSHPETGTVITLVVPGRAVFRSA